LLFGGEQQDEKPRTTLAKVDSKSVKSKAASTSAWEDDDDDNLQVDIAVHKRLRKLDKSHTKHNVSASELSELLQDRFQPSALDWATSDNAEDNVESGEAGDLI
jgi:hypothetical protein